MGNRVIGFDLARAYAIFGMFIVNFNFCFGTFQDTSIIGTFLNLFVGNSTAIFIILAGMGVSFMSNKSSHSIVEKLKLRSVILKRSWFLLVLGLLLYTWWPGDILHFYGGYMHIAAFILFVPKKYYLWFAFGAIGVFQILLNFIPIDTSWNFSTFEYADFWTPVGFLRNTFYNGWNSIFPWMSYFLVGLFLGKLNWENGTTKKWTLVIGVILFLLVEGLRYFAKGGSFNTYWTHYTMSEYFPAYAPFVLITIGFAFMIISACMFISDRHKDHKIVKSLVSVGQMTLTFYVVHITLGMLLFQKLTGHEYTGYLSQSTPEAPGFILLFASLFYFLCVIFAAVWKRKYKNGPLELLMRKFSD